MLNNLCRRVFVTVASLVIGSTGAAADDAAADVRSPEVSGTSDGRVAENRAAENHAAENLVAEIRVDDPGWRTLGPNDFAAVNGDDDTWRWDGDTLRCTGEPLGVIRTAKTYRNVEITLRWMHERRGGNSGLFVWVSPESVRRLADPPTPGLPDGVEVQMLDHGFTEIMAARGEDTSWFGTNGDVFGVNKPFDPFPPTSPDGSRSFPLEKRSHGHGRWNRYYVRAIDGEVRLWVNGVEVSGGNGVDPASGYLCLESEGSPIRFEDIRVRELP